MTIKWFGQSCFNISFNSGKNSPVNMIIDPFDESIGLKLPKKLEADIVLVTHDHYDHNNVKRVSGFPFVISGSGEYDVKNVFVQGINSLHNDKGEKNTIYKIEAENINVCHLGDLGQKELAPEQISGIGEVDILMIPIGGHFTLDAKNAAKVMAQIEPKIVIPMHYKLPGLKIGLDSLNEFSKVLGIKEPEKLPKLAIKEKDLPGEETKVIVLEV